MPIYVNYDGITGDVTATGHEQWVEVSSFQWGVGRGISTPTGSGGDRESSAPSVSEVVVTKPYDTSSIGFFQELLTPGDAKKAVIDFCKTDKDKLTVYMSVELDNVMISGYSVSSGGDRPNESLSFNFTKVIVTEMGSSETGQVGQPTKAGYDLAAAKPM
jgi:type VI secretion system secreted protein Hcp